ncbi:unnamed protein product [Hymenolepis diminuta]|uniref:RT_RNaseH domain-containing protein n=1 Tax=Hymenolepis diminuta TaxID=6216 RepID=A0A0R3SGE0_HYMDI|nr:unnamed protein product [Hymenolepis diminuta]
MATDVSSYDGGAVISHVFPDGSVKAVAHSLCSLMPTEINYRQIEKEALGTVNAVKIFHKVVCRSHFTLLTDPKPLSLSFIESKKSIPTYSAVRLQHWTIISTEYDSNINYWKSNEF